MCVFCERVGVLFVVCVWGVGVSSVAYILPGAW